MLTVPRQSPKRKPKLIKNVKEDDKPLPPPKKFVAFAPHDSSAIEAAYQDLADTLDDPQQEIKRTDSRSMESDVGGVGRDTGAGDDTKNVRVPVHEDFLFDVDVSNRELAPVYWLGPIYEVRRGR